MKEIKCLCLLGASLLVFVGCEEQEAAASEQEAVASAEQKISQGRTSEITPNEADAWRKKNLAAAEAHRQKVEARSDQAKAKFSPKEIEIYEFMKTRWTALAEGPSGYNPDVHDELVTAEAARKFGVTEKEVGDIYVKVDMASLGLK